MSIILNALKKVQDRDATDTSGGVAASEEAETSAPGAVIAQASPASRGEMGSGPGDLSFGAMKLPVDRHTGTAADIEADRHRFGGTPKMLLGLILALGVFTTGWFVSRLYIDSKSADSTEETSLQANVAQPEQTIRATGTASPQGQPASMPMQTPPVVSTPAAPTAAVASGLPASSDQSVNTPALELAPQQIEPETRESSSRNSAAGRKRAGSEEARGSEKEADGEKGGRPDLKVNAIAWRSEEPKAIVNMQRVYVGDKIEGAKVVAIQKSSVVFEYKGETFEVRF